MYLLVFTTTLCPFKHDSMPIESGENMPVQTKLTRKTLMEASCTESIHHIRHHITALDFDKFKQQVFTSQVQLFRKKNGILGPIATTRRRVIRRMII